MSIRDQDKPREALHKAHSSRIADGRHMDTEKKFQNLVEHINDWVWEVDENCVYTYASPRVCKLLGYTPDEILGRTPFDLMSPDESMRVRELFYPIFRRQDDFYLLENALIKKDGGRVVVETSGTPIYDDQGVFIGYRGIDRDITEHKRAEDALQKSEERFRHLVEFSPIPMAINDADDNITYLNEKFIKTFGYTREDIPDLKHWWKIAYPDPAYRREIKNAWTKSIEKSATGTRDIGPMEAAVTCKDGSIRYIEFTGTTMEDKKLVILQDITEKKAAERALKFIQFSIEKAAEMLIWVSPDGRITNVNEAACRSFGYTREEMLSLKTFDTNPYFNESNWGEHWNAIKERGSFNFEASLRKKDGSMFPAEISVNYLVYEGNEYNCSFVRDITERKKVEEMLRESEGRFRQLAENINEVFFIFTNDWDQTVYVSPAYEQVWGRSLKSVYDVPLSWTLAIAIEDRAAVQAVIDRIKQSDTPDLYTVEFRITRPDGSLRWISAKAYAVRDKGGKMFRIAGIAEDITGRKQIELELGSAKDQAELYVDLMGHDINNLNQVGMGFLELALDTLNLDENGRLIIAKSLGALEGSSRLIDNVRKLQRVKSGELHGQAMDLGQILAEVQKNYLRTSGKENSIHYSPASGYLVMANELLYDVFSNLVNNAIKHTQVAPVIDISLRKVYGDGRIFYQVAVEDNGPGIPDELKVKVFNRHLRGNTKAKGSGVGLYLVKTLVDSYSGRVWVEDRVSGDRSQGSRFVVMLPAIEE